MKLEELFVYTCLIFVIIILVFATVRGCWDKKDDGLDWADRPRGEIK